MAGRRGNMGRTKFDHEVDRARLASLDLSLFHALRRSSAAWLLGREKPRRFATGLHHQVPRTGSTSLRYVGPGLAVKWIKPGPLRWPRGFFMPFVAQALLGSSVTKKPCRFATGLHHQVPRTGLEPAQPFGHYPLKVACLPISPPGHTSRLSAVRGGKYSSPIHSSVGGCCWAR